MNNPHKEQTSQSTNLTKHKPHKAQTSQRTNLTKNEPHKERTSQRTNLTKNNPHKEQPSQRTTLTKKPLPPLKIMNYVCIVLTSDGTLSVSPCLFWTKKG